jgi:hypothetical protein
MALMANAYAGQSSAVGSLPSEPMARMAGYASCPGGVHADTSISQIWDGSVRLHRPYRDVHLSVPTVCPC